MREKRSTHRVMLVAPVPPPYGGMALQAGLLEKSLRRDGIAVLFFASTFALPEWLRPVGRIPGLRTIARAGLIWVKLWREVRKIEVVHVLAASWLYFFVVVCPAVVVGRLLRKRIVLNYRGGSAAQFFRWFGFAAGPFLKAATVITAPSEFLAETIRNRFGTPVAIVPNIVDLSLFRFRQRMPVGPKLLVARHLEKIYDIESVLRAFWEVQRKHPGAALCIAGSGNQEEHLRNLATVLRLNNVRFLGHVDHDTLPDVYDQNDIFINASRVDNFPGALLEASAAGLPIISTCAGGIPFIYENGKNALLREPGDWKGLASAVEEVLSSPPLAAKLAAEGVALAQRYEWAGVRGRLYQVYGMAPEREPLQIVSLA